MQYAQYCTQYSNTWITTTHMYGCCLLTSAQHSAPSFSPSWPLNLETWIMDFLTNRPQHVRSGDTCSTTITLNTGVPQGCVLSPFLYSLYTHDCRPMHGSNSIIKFADDTTVIGLIRDNDETAYREEVQHLAAWCPDNNLLLNTSKTKELIVDFRKKKGGTHDPIHINGMVVKRVSSFKFLGTHISEDLTWTTNTSSLVKKAHQCLFFLRTLKKNHLSSAILLNFYRCAIESILINCIPVWYGNCSVADRKALQRVVKTAQCITGTPLPAIEDVQRKHCLRRARCILKDSSHPDHRLFNLLPSGRCFRSLRTKTSRLRNSLFPTAVSLLNSARWSPSHTTTHSSPLPITKSVYIFFKKTFLLNLVLALYCLYIQNNEWIHLHTEYYVLEIIIFYALSMSVALVFIYLNVSLIHIHCNCS